MPKISKAIKNGVTYDFHDASIGSIASDHLEEKALVGELYTLNDEMFLQNTPALADATIDQNVGDTAANTQIHIQRIASGTASNKLKLKIKKVGTPGDLTVQVMKGISVTVTANVEAYWYGDSSNIVASGTLAASNVTTSYQELEVTLGDNFGGTEGDLLDVVLSQSSVNASNYYVIACDSTQWSEAFSFVAVNGSTRTRSKLMPYCISDGFAQRLLCKVGSNISMDVLVYKVTGDASVGPGAHIFPAPYDDMKVTLSKPFNLSATWTAHHTQNYSAINYTIPGVIGSTSDNNRVDGGTKTSTWSNQNYDINGSIQMTTSSINYGSPVIHSVEISKTYTMSKTGTSSKYRDLVGIGEICGITIFGYHIDGTWINH